MIKIGSQFSGVGAFEQSLIRLGIEFKNIYAADWDRYARQTYLLNFEEPEYYVKDVHDTPIKELTDKHGSLDIAMFSPPCQAFSMAGKRMGKDDQRGILFFNSLEFIKENKPRYFIFENVKGLLSHDKQDKNAVYGRTFQEWINYLGGKSVNGVHTFFPYEDSVPYHIYFQVLNAKHYGIPQNRERVFIIGIRDDQDNDFQFPKPFPLEKRLKDVLEMEVDEKYFLSDKMLGYLNTRKDNFNNGNINYKDENSVASTLTKSSSSIDISDNILKVGYVNQDTQASQVFSEKGTSPNICAGTHGYALGYVETEIGTWRTHEDGRGFRATEDNNCPTIPARAREDGSGQPVIKIGAILGRKSTDIVKVARVGRSDEGKRLRKESLNRGKDYTPFQAKEITFEESDIMNCVTTSTTKDNLIQMLEINENGTSNALTTVQKDNVVVIDEIINPLKDKTDYGWHFEQAVYDSNGITRSLKSTEGSGNKPKVIIDANTSKGYDEAEEEEDSINFSVPSSKTRRGRVGKKVSQTLDTQCNQGIATKQLSKQEIEKLEKDKSIIYDLTNDFGEQIREYEDYSPSLRSERSGLATNTQQRIRRLTPTEAFRLMDFNTEMIEKTIGSGLISDSQCYKQAGNSICVGVLSAIISKLKF